VHSANTVAGGLPPEEIAVAARSMGLDFVAATGHNTADEHRAWAPYGDDELLVIPGQEVVTRNGHWLALGLRPGQLVDWRHQLGDGVLYARVAEVRDAGGICVAAHPHAPYPSGVLMYPFDSFDAVEVWNGAWASNAPWQADNRAAVAEWGRSVGTGIYSGQWRPAIGNSDTAPVGAGSRRRQASICRSRPVQAAALPGSVSGW
jgi:predicted metal-dependent phosphoesterase TrpH